MNTADLIISIVFVCINSAALFLIYRAISRWMTRNEKKIDNLEHAVLKIDDYIKYSSHTIDAVYLDALDRLIKQYVKDEKYEVAELKKNIELLQYKVLNEMMQRKKEAEKKLYEDFLNKEHNQKKGDTKEG